MAVHVLNKNSQVPCNLRNMLSSMNFIVSHVFKEGNHCADGLVNIGLSLTAFTVWHTIPSNLQEVYFKNKLGWPNFRFVPF